MAANNGKKTILFMTDLATTGFGRVGEEIVTRFAQLNKYNIIYLGWVARSDPDLHFKWKQLGVRIETTELTVQDQFAQRTFDRCVKMYRPDLVWTLGDPWMVEHVANNQHRTSYKWVSYIPIDRDVIPEAWLADLKNPDALVLYSKFGQKVIERQLPRVKTEMIYHGVDTSMFKPIDKQEAKQRCSIDPKKFVIGFVGRNQIRKRIPRLINAYKGWSCKRYKNNEDIRSGDQLYSAEQFCPDIQKWRCESCPHFKQNPEYNDSTLYLHTTVGYTDNNDGLWVGWHIGEYSKRFKLEDTPNGKSRISITDPSMMRTIQGVDDNYLNYVYNSFDIHILPSCREGFGLPILEAMACGVPSIVTNYSSMPELVEDGRGFLADIIGYDEEPFWDAPSALVDIKSIIDHLNALPELARIGKYDDMKKKCRAYALKHDWKYKFREWNDLFSELLT